MLRPVDNYFLQQEEPTKSCLEFLRAHILGFDSHISEKWSYGMPFYIYKEKRICYLWVHKKLKQPYLGLVDGKLFNDPELLAEKRSRMKIFLVDPAKNIPVKKINTLLKQAIRPE
jgi:hypothetical protein